jgi:hypothetical protein
MTHRTYVFVAVLGILGCARPVKEPDILDVAAASPLLEEYAAPGEEPRAPRFGDPELERAERVLGDIPRPWTLPVIRARFRSERDPRRRELLLRVLAASRDARAAVVLGAELEGDDAELQAAAIEGLGDYFLPYLVSGGLEALAAAVETWWAENKTALAEEAARLERRLGSS